MQYPPIYDSVHALLHGGDYNPDQWLHDPAVLEEDVRLMKKAGVNCVSVAIFAWALLEPEEGVYNFQWLDDVLDRLYQNGIHVILATPSGARPAWMDEKYPEVRRINFHRVRELHNSRHNHCNTSPKYKELVTKMNTKLVERYGNHPAVILWHISNEYGGECYCDLCEASFREWLREKYHNNIEELNMAWWTSFWSRRYASFEEIEAPAAHGETGIHGLNLDWKRFTTWRCAQFIKTEIAPLKAIAPHLPVTTNFMGSTTGPVYDGLNYQHLTEDLDRIAWDSYPRWHQEGTPLWLTAGETAFVYDFTRSLGRGKPFLLMESTPSCVNWHPVNKLKRPGVHRLSALQAIAHGSDTVQYFQWRKSRGSGEKFHGAVVDHVGHEHTRIFRDVAEVGRMLETLSPVQGAGVPVQAAVVYDIENRWAIEDANFLSVYRDYEGTCIAHHRALWRQGIAADVVSQDADLSSYKLVTAPMSYMLHPGFAKKVADFVREGGTFVATYVSGWVNDTDLCFLGGFPGEELRQVLGIWEEETDSLYPGDRNGMVFSGELSGTYEIRDFCSRIHPETAEVIATYESDFYAGEPAATVNRFGRGKAYFLAARTGDDMLYDFYRKLCADAGIPGALPGVTLPLGVSVTCREGAEGRFLFVMNFTDQPQTLELPEEMTDMLTGTAFRELTLAPQGAAVLREEVRP